MKDFAGSGSRGKKPNSRGIIKMITVIITIIIMITIMMMMIMMIIIIIMIIIMIIMLHGSSPKTAEACWQGKIRRHDFCAISLAQV